MSDLFENLACELNKNNVSIEIHRVASPNLLAIGENIVLDFSEHDKVFEDKIASLEKRMAEMCKLCVKNDIYKIEKAQLCLLRDENKKLKQRIAELESENEKLFDYLNGITGNTKEEIRNNIDNIGKINKKPTKINLNDRIKVKLTPLGAEIYYHQCDDVNKKIKENGGTELEPIMPRIDKDRYTEFQLWHFIELYGKHIGMCKPNVIEPLDIVLVE